MPKDIVSIEGRQWNRRDAGEVELARKFAVLGLDSAKNLLVKVDQVHFVDGQHHVPYPQQRGDAAMAVGLYQQSFAGIDQQHGQICRRGAGGHVAGILFMPWGVSHDKAPFGRREKTIGHIDGDALLALGLQAIDEQ